MLDKSQINEWQFIDQELDLVYPWYTKPFLKELETWDLKDKKVLEIGGGFSTIWWNAKCSNVETVEFNEEWMNKILETNTNINIDSILLAPIYPRKEDLYDIIIIDNDEIDRDFIVEFVLELIKDKGIIICDNWMQPEVWICKNPSLLERFEHKIFKQPNHPNWQTAYFIIDKNL